MTKTPFRYPGAKNKMLPILMEYIDKILISQNEFCDAFIGGGSVLLEVAEKYPNIKLYANDKDNTIFNFWQIVSDINPINLKALLDMLSQAPTLDIFYKLRSVPAKNNVESAYRAIFFNRTTFSGIAHSGPIGGKDQKSKYTIDCRYNFKKLKEKILYCHSLLSGRTEISNFSIDKFPLMSGICPMYLDPPYYKKGDDLYPEKMDNNDHKNLSVLLDKRSNWVLSYDDCIDIRNLYVNKNIIDLSARYCINGKKDNWNSKNELIILGN